MPTYVCVVKAGLLNNLQKHRIAARQLPACTARPPARRRGSCRW